MNRRKIFVASSNKGKINEIREIFSEYEVLSISDLGIDIDIDEDQDTFEGNAVKKATELSKITGTACIADDSGISIDYLNGFPGVYTARWLKGTDRQRNLGIIEKMKNVEKNKRHCTFVTAIALVDVQENLCIVKTHNINGSIAIEVRGENGFGFDEIFELESGKTIAELTGEEKNKLSPRKYALESIRKEL